MINNRSNSPITTTAAVISLRSVAKIAEMETPKVQSYLKSEDAWTHSLCLKPEALLEDPEA